MSKKSIIKIVFITTVIVCILGYAYNRYKINEITNKYDWVTLMQIKSNLNSIVYYIEEQYQNKPISKDEYFDDEVLYNYFKKMYIDSIYIGKSPNFRDTLLDLNLDKISDMDDNGGISVNEIEYLNNVHNNYKIVLDEIDDERDKNIINRLFGVLNRLNVMKLSVVFEDVPES